MSNTNGIKMRNTMKEEFITPDTQYQAPGYVGQSPDKVGIDHFMLHFGLWSNHYSKRLQQAGIRYNPESKTLKMTCDANSHLQIYNPVANFWDAITYVGLLSMYENKFASGDVKELIGTVGSEELNLFGVSANSFFSCVLSILLIAQKLSITCWGLVNG